MARVLAIGDIVSQIGCDFLRQKLPNFKSENNIDVVIANGENSAIGNGILPLSANHILDSGVDVITTGNHVFKRREIYSYLDETPQVIRPANFPTQCNGNGYYLHDKGAFQLAVINLMGVSYMDSLDSPFIVVDKLLNEIHCKNIIVDFHAEATGEKKALGYYLDGRVSAVFGTHTHVQTADEQILPKKTGFITDIGMTGPTESVLGVVPECVIERFITKMPTRFEVAKSECMLEGVIITLNEKTGECTSIERIRIT
ncbi:MAG: TIGR00282 family metallophosphoesterase [Oscillospiraceae bacterium]